MNLSEVENLQLAKDGGLRPSAAQSKETNLTRLNWRILMVSISLEIVRLFFIQRAV